VAVLSAKLTSGPRRSVERQLERRRLERSVKRSVIALVRLGRMMKLGWERIAALLRLPLSTLRGWCAGWREDRLAVSSRGRPLQRARREVRNTVLAVLVMLGAGISIEVLGELFPGVARRELQDIVARYRRVLRKRGVLLHQLTWLNRGAVWATDCTEAPQPVDGTYRYVLSVRDLAAGKQLLALPVPDTSAQVVCDALRALFAEHGAPLVLKSDNGSGFIAADTRALLAKHGVQHLLSPPGTPSYNGACEAGIGGMKRRTELLAARNDRLLDWTCDDLFAALLWANYDHYPNGLAGGTAAGRFAVRPTLGEAERNTFRDAVVQSKQELYAAACTAGDVSTDKLRAVYHRRAVRRILVEHDYLSINWRSIPQPIHTAKCARIM
jgi:transposase InsO family protein